MEKKTGIRNRAAAVVVGITAVCILGTALPVKAETPADTLVFAAKHNEKENLRNETFVARRRDEEKRMGSRHRNYDRPHGGNRRRDDGRRHENDKRPNYGKRRHGHNRWGNGGPNWRANRSRWQRDKKRWGDKYERW